MKKKQNPVVQKTLADAPQTHLYTASDGKSLEIALNNGDIWMSQKEMAELFGVGVQAVGKQIKNVIRDDKLGNSVISKTFITASDGKSYEVNIYNLSVIIPVGYRLNNSPEATKFRAWANGIIEKYLTIGVVVNEPLLESRAMLAKQNIIEKHEKAGYGNTENIVHMKAELDVTRSLKLMNEMIAKVVTSPQYGHIHNAKLEALFGLKSAQIKAILNCKNIHEGLPIFGLNMLDVAHKNIIEILRMQNRGQIANEVAIAGIEMAVKPLGDYLRNLCNQLGIDPLTGKSLLGNGKDKQ